jgi:hypothetical protein
MTKPLIFSGDDEWASNDISVTKMEIAIRASWNVFHLAGDLRRLGQGADARSAEQMARIAYRRAVVLLPGVVDDAERTILGRAVEELEVMLRQPT